MALTPNKAGYQYLWDMITDIEQNQCVTCRFRKNPDDEGQHAQEYPMCFEVEGEIIVEDSPVEALDKDDSGDVVCTKYTKGDPWES